MIPHIAPVARAVVVAVAMAAAPGATAQPIAGPLQLLDVPYVPQSVELCGGAAAAMVLRYWGATGVYAESFEALVDPEAGGIRTQDLRHALEARGWSVLSFAGDPPRVRQHLQRRQPPIALIEDRPGRFHYVVVVGWSDGRVVLHDPARAPFRILDERAFIAAWERAEFWTLVALPGAEAPPAASGSSEPTVGMAPAWSACADMVAEGVRLAREQAVAEAAGLLEIAAARCPGDPAVWRELAGVHATRKDWRRAAGHARRALAQDPADRHAAEILATSLFLEGDRTGALDAWNMAGGPMLDLVEVQGLDRVPYDVAARALALVPGRMLTAPAMRRGARRLTAVPSIAAARVSYTPNVDGTAQVSASILERPRFPVSAGALMRASVRAAAEREARAEIANAAGRGELWFASWRWWRPRAAVSFGLTIPGRRGGVWTVEASEGRETYARGEQRLEERRRRISMQARDWVTAAVRWEAGLALDRWASGESVSLSGGILLAPGERLELGFTGGIWAGAERTWQASAEVSWRSRSTQDGAVWLLRAAGHAAGETAPFALWEGGGTGAGRSELLRAHPLLRDGVVSGGAFGRRVVAASGEWRLWRRPMSGVVRIAPAAFLDVAHARSVGGIGDPRLHADAGVGARLSFAGWGVVRADVARGLRDGRMAASLGWSPR